MQIRRGKLTAIIAAVMMLFGDMALMTNDFMRTFNVLSAAMFFTIGVHGNVNVVKSWKEVRFQFIANMVAATFVALLVAAIIASNIL